MLGARRPTTSQEIAEMIRFSEEEVADCIDERKDALMATQSLYTLLQDRRLSFMVRDLDRVEVSIALEQVHQLKRIADTLEDVAAALEKR